MEMIIEKAAGGIEGAGFEAAVLVAVAYLALRWLWLGVRADLARLRGRDRRLDPARDAHEEAFDRGMQRLLAELESPEPAWLRRAA